MAESLLLTLPTLAIAIAALMTAWASSIRTNSERNRYVNEQAKKYDDLSKQIVALEIKAQALSQRESQYIKSIEDLSHKLDKANEQLVVATAKILELDHKLGTTNEQLVSANGQIKVSNTQIGSLNEKLDSANAQLLAANTQLAQANQQITSLHTQISSLNAQISDMTVQIKGLIDYQATLKEGAA